MPSSSEQTIPAVIELVEQIGPSSVLDIGIGFGKWGFLLREYLEVWSWDEALFQDAHQFKWKIKIDGIEIFDKYVKDLQRNIYSQIFVGDCVEILQKVNDYDLIIMGDVIEHFDRPQGVRLIESCLEKAKDSLLIVTPATFYGQEGVLGNEAEKHRSLWTKEDFKKFGNATCLYTTGSLIAVICKWNRKFRCREIYSPLVSAVHQAVARLQARNIERYGIAGSNESLSLRLYAALSNFRRRRQQGS